MSAQRSGHMSGGWVPAHPPPAGLSPRDRRLYAAIECGQKQRPSVQKRRRLAAWSTQAKAVEKAGYVLQAHISQYTYRGITPGWSDPRLSWSGRARPMRNRVRTLMATIRARERGVVLKNTHLTTSTPRLRALLTRWLMHIDIGGGAHLQERYS